MKEQTPGAQGKAQAIRHAISDYMRQRQLHAKWFDANLQEIINDNLSMLKKLLSLTVFITLALILVSFTVPVFRTSSTVYIFALMACLPFFFYYHTSPRTPTRFSGILPAFYAYLSILFCVLLYLSIFITPTETGTTIVAFFALMPLCVMDKSWRINTFSAVFFGIHSLLSYLYKTPAVFAGDVVTCGCIAVCGMLLGAHIRFVKLNNFELRRRQELQKSTDFLTKLGNRRKMFDTLKQSEASLRPEEKITGTIMLDIDHFKHLNDTCGHQYGDDCLEQLGACLLAFGDAHDLPFFRYGGEEFIAFSRTYTYGELAFLAELLRQAVYDLNIPYEGSHHGRVTVSIGYAQTDKNHPTGYEALITMADKALYYAKETGRNKTVGYDANVAAAQMPPQNSAQFRQRD